MEAGKLRCLKNLFVEFVTWLFLLPLISCKDSILAFFGRCCALCDALFLASVQLPKARVTGNTHWKNIFEELVEGKRKSKWFDKVKTALQICDLSDKSMKGGSYMGKGKLYSVQLAQYCYHNHLNGEQRTSADGFPFQRLRFWLD